MWRARRSVWRAARPRRTVGCSRSGTAIVSPRGSSAGRACTMVRRPAPMSVSQATREFATLVEGEAGTPRSDRVADQVEWDGSRGQIRGESRLGDWRLGDHEGVGFEDGLGAGQRVAEGRAAGTPPGHDDARDRPPARLRITGAKRAVGGAVE